MYPTTYGFWSERRRAPLPTPASTLALDPTRRRSSWLLSFTGLLPVLLSVPLILQGLWVPALMVGLLANLAVIAYHLGRGQGVSSLDAVSLAFNATNAVLFFGFGIAALLEHLDACVYALLVAQVAWGFVQGVPWTMQFARRSTPAALWQTPEFLTANKMTSTAWFAAFLASFAMAVLVPSGNVRFLLPVALIGLTAVCTPRLARRAMNRPRATAARAAQPGMAK
jgi:hypothetical protein